MNDDHKSVIEKSFRTPLRDVSFRKLMSSSCVFFEDVDSPTALALWLMLKYKSYDEYLNYEINPFAYMEDDIQRFQGDYQCSKMFTKSEVFPHLVETRKIAERKFIECEVNCATVNRTIYNDGILSLFQGKDAENEVFHLATRKISAILGSAPSVNDLRFTFGPGLNVGLSNNKTNVVDKLTAKPTITKALKQFIGKNPISHHAWDHLLAGCPSVPSTPFSAVIDRFEEVPGSRLSFVPKTAKTDRPICIEPLYNSYVQSGIGNAIRSKLRKAGCDLRSQDLNQALAWYGSVYDTLCTMDLSSASDTISYGVVEEMLPRDWFSLLDASRSSCFTYEGRVFPLEKISSMGNGFTFELESLLFLALARAACQVIGCDSSLVNTYGDDIIIPTEAYSLLQSTLQCIGFSVNQEKSFSHGLFRESCGSDFFNGIQVRPLFLKRRPTPASMVYWCNHIRRMSDMYGSGYGDPIYHRWYVNIKRLVPRIFYNLKGPDGQGDGHFVERLSDCSHNRDHSHGRRGWEGFGFYSVKTEPLLFKTDDSASFALALYNADRPTERQTRIPKHWDLAITQRQRTRNVVTKKFALWADPPVFS